LRVASVAPTFMLRFARDEDHELMALFEKRATRINIDQHRSSSTSDLVD
jgi:hypothetical protein